MLTIDSRWNRLEQMHTSDLDRGTVETTHAR
jgi:hypothetical protein